MVRHFPSVVVNPNSVAALSMNVYLEETVNAAGIFVL